jgi:hypothetical protein
MDNPFVGTWLLVSQQNEYPDGRSLPARGEAPAGILMYDAAGNMAVQLMRTDDRAGAYTDLASLETAMNGFHAYFGRYEIQPDRGVIVHHVRGSGFPGYMGTSQVRHYSFSGDHLTLRAESAGGVWRVLVWQRA